MAVELVSTKKGYFACAIRGEQGGREEKELIVSTIKALGHVVVSEIFVAQDANWNQSMVMTPGQVVDQDLGWIENSEFIVADVTRLSHGVGFELGWAAAKGILTVALCREDKFDGLSNMIKGFPDSRYSKGNFSVHTWRGIDNTEDVQQILEEKLGRVGAVKG